MKAQDTVMKGDKASMLLDATFGVGEGEIPYAGFDLEPLLIAQAEISFKAGIKEVVEFAKRNNMTPFTCDYRITGTVRQDDEHREDCRKCKWQAKLKEWEVK